MSHSPIIIDGCLTDLMGNATTGKVKELKTAADALNATLADHPNEAAHELLSEVQQAACDAAMQFHGFAKQCSDMMP